jgi:magnesium transporter
MLLDLRFSIWTLALTGGTFIAALYGMNLKNFIEESDLGFGGVSVTCAVCGFIVAFYGFRKLQRVQRLSMWGHGGDKHAATKGSWGVGAWGGKSSSADAMGVPRLRAGESLGDLIQRERLLARRIAKAEVQAEEAARSGTPGVGKLRF